MLITCYQFPTSCLIKNCQRTTGGSPWVFIMEYVVTAENIAKKYKIYSNPWHRALEWIAFDKKQMHKEFWALKDISFKVKHGECLGIIGPNGAGKSTLLKILTRALHPTEGTFQIQGRVLSLLELGTGFNAELTGRQNLYNSAHLLGFPGNYIEEKIPDIEAFAELGEFFDRPIKLYSSGMYVRLAFSMFACLEPDVLIVDEALSVGDIFFQQKCYDHIRRLLQKGTGLLFVSHDMSVVRNLCQTLIFLRQGEIIFQGDPAEGVSRYYALESLGNQVMHPAVPAGMKAGTSAKEGIVGRKKVEEIINHSLPINPLRRYGKGKTSIQSVALEDDHGHYVPQVRMMERLHIHILLRAKEATGRVDFGIHLYDRLGNVVFCCRAGKRGLVLPMQKVGEETIATITLKMSLQPGEYTFSLGVREVTPCDNGNGVTRSILDRCEGLGPIGVLPPSDENLPFHGMAYLPMEVTAMKVLPEK